RLSLICTQGAKIGHQSLRASERDKAEHGLPEPSTRYNSKGVIVAGQFLPGGQVRSRKKRCQEGRLHTCRSLPEGAIPGMRSNGEAPGHYCPGYVKVEHRIGTTCHSSWKADGTVRSPVHK